MNNVSAFIELTKAGLWGTEVHLSRYQPLDYGTLFQMSSDQSIVGLIAAGIEQAIDTKVPEQQVLSLLGQVRSLETRNTDLNNYISWLFPRLKEEGIFPVLVKGQGVAQCYIRPLWRSAGDIDIFLAEGDYEKAKKVLMPIAQCVENEVLYRKHLALTISGVDVELHGTLRTCLSRRIDRVLDNIQREAFNHDDFRIWQDGEANPDDHVVFVFVHILQHFFKGGVGLRQVCDWCRLLWTYRKSIDKDKLSSRLTEMKLASEWNAFATLAVEVLGMPSEAIPFYVRSKNNTRQSQRILSFIIDAGNFGHNRDKSYIANSRSIIVRKCISLWRQIKDSFRLLKIFPMDSMHFFFSFVYFRSKGLIIE